VSGVQILTRLPRFGPSQKFVNPVVRRESHRGGLLLESAEHRYCKKARILERRRFALLQRASTDCDSRLSTRYRYLRFISIEFYWRKTSPLNFLRGNTRLQRASTNLQPRQIASLESLFTLRHMASGPAGVILYVSDRLALVFRKDLW
jgi:hypothetical protein